MLMMWNIFYVVFHILPVSVRGCCCWLEKKEKGSGRVAAAVDIDAVWSLLTWQPAKKIKFSLFSPYPNQLKKWHKNTWKWRSKWAVRGWERTWYISILVIHSIQRFQTRIEKWMSKRRRIFVVVEFFMSRIRKTHQSKRRAGSSASGMRGKKIGDTYRKRAVEDELFGRSKETRARARVVCC